MIRYLRDYFQNWTQSFCFQSCQLFMSVAIENAGIDYHVVLAQNALQLCLDNWELQAELLCALVKQTSKHASHKHGVQVFSKLRHRVSSPSHCFFFGGVKKAVVQ